jgi:sterol desaturase/sphingolipid hydroxylase (fatty acid hydroxylase superfamily)
MMDHTIFSHLDSITVTAILLIIGLVEVLTGSYVHHRRDDWLINLISVSQFALLIKPLIILLSSALMSVLFPHQKDLLAHYPLWLGMLLVMVPDDFLHYLYHRKGHEWGWLWRIHRTHHTAPELGVAVAFRENWQWYMFMPSLWYSASLIYFGLGKEYILVTLIVGIHNVLIHTSTRWDRPLYQHVSLSSVAWVLERLIQLPSTHRTHHAQLTANGDIPRENYGQLFYIWDWLFGTAHFERDRYPRSYGIPEDPKYPWYTQLWYPLSILPKKGNDIESN